MAVQVNPYVNGTGPYPHFRRVMVFVDGENLVCRYQDMLVEGANAHPSVQHLRNVFAWSTDTVKIAGLYEVERASYYTYCMGDEAAVESASSQLKNLRFTPHLGSQLPSNLFPRVFWKPKTTTGKGVDIQMTVDVLAHAYRDNYDILYLVSGDGDYKPLIEEVARLGKQVYVAALSSGLNAALPKVADVFVDLDPYYTVK
jgi:uncharacterized LabA/DUF88 family protein